MKRINDLRDLLIEQGRELYDATRQEERELPLTERQASNPKLKQLLKRQLKVAKSQRSRLDEAFRKLDTGPDGEKNPCYEAMIRQTKDLISRTHDPDVRDAAIVNSIQRLSHLKMASFGSLAAYANQIGEGDIARTVHEALEEERNIDLDLSKLAEEEINAKAVHMA